MRLKFFALLFFVSVASSDRVVCIHGILPQPGAMVKMRHGLFDAGFYTHAFKYPSRKYTIEQHGERLVKYLHRLEKKYPEQRIHFVVHSMGGLVLRSAMNHPDFPESMKRGRSVLIGTPNKGSILARKLDNFFLARMILGDNAGKQLREYREKNIVQLGQFPEGYPVLVIAGTKGSNPLLDGVSDGTVLVKETRLETPHEFYKVRARHPFMTGHPQVIARTIDYLKEAE